MNKSDKNISDEYLIKLTESFGPKVPFEDLVIGLNNIYHRYEAKIYDRRHPEIFKQICERWRELFHEIKDGLPDKGLRILDYGCGTGFELAEFIKSFPHHRIESVQCFDPSIEMLQECERSISQASWAEKVTYTCEPKQALLESSCHLILTNSVMHHIYNYDSVVESFYKSLLPGGFWISGHEPSSRFYKNQRCWNFLKSYEKNRRWRRFFSPRKWTARFSVNPAKLTAKRAVEEGLFTSKPSAAAVSRLVDCWVAHSPEEAQAGRGFDFQEQQNSRKSKFKLVKYETYSYLGPFSQVVAPKKWQKRCDDLATKFPDDGANFCTVWQRLP